MTVDQLLTEATSLPPEQRKLLIGRLLALGRGERDDLFRQRLTEKVDDQDPNRWVPMEDLAKHLRLTPE